MGKNANTQEPAKPVRLVASAPYVDIYVRKVATMQTCVCIYNHNGACLHRVSELLVEPLMWIHFSELFDIIKFVKLK